MILVFHIKFKLNLYYNNLNIKKINKKRNNLLTKTYNKQIHTKKNWHLKKIFKQKTPKKSLNTKPSAMLAPDL